MKDPEEKTIMESGARSRPLQLRADSRGWLLKMLMRQHIDGDREFGEIYVTAAHPGQVKGNHYHRSATEWFCVIQGTGRLVARDVATGAQEEFLLSAEAPATVLVPPNVAHAVQNVGEGLMLLLAYADTPYDFANPDEVRHVLLEPLAAGVSAR
jgi:dTDP-4-dehydrorhamnose 3,5-epimerase-like enzyme